MHAVCISVIEDDPDLQKGTEEDFQDPSEDIIMIPNQKYNETVADVQISKDLSEEQEMQVIQVLAEFKDVLTGKTNLIEHRIK